MLKAIIFDIDDTLLDWQGRTRSWEEHEWEHLGRVFDYINQEVYPLEKRERFYEDTLATIIAGWGHARKTLQAPHLAQILVESLVKQGVPRNLIDPEACLRAYRAEPIPGVRPFPDVIPELGRLQSYRLKLGLVTNALQPMVLRDVELQALGLIDFFKPEHRFSAADVGYLKPHPHIFQAVLNALGVEIHEAVFVGDSLRADIVGAQRMGIRAVLRYRPDDLPSALGDDNREIVPDGKITSLTDLYPLLDDWFPDWRAAHSASTAEEG